MNTPPPLPMNSSHTTVTNRPSGWIFVALGSSSLALAMIAFLVIGAIRSGDGGSDFEDHGYQDTYNSRAKVAVARIQSLEGQLGVIRRNLATTEAEKASHDAKVTAYMMNHKMAVAALAVGGAGAGVMLDDSNGYSEDAKALGGVAAGLAIIYALANSDEVLEVFNYLTSADVMKKQYESRIAELKRQLSTLQSEIRSEESRIG